MHIIKRYHKTNSIQLSLVVIRQNAKHKLRMQGNVNI